MAFSDEARRSAALARKIKHQLGESAYKEFKRTGNAPAGLKGHTPASKPPISQEARAAFGSLSRADQILKAAAQKPKLTVKIKAPKVDPTVAKLAAAMPPLSDPSFLESWRKQVTRKPERSKLASIARAQAVADLPDSHLISHFKETQIYARRGVANNTVAKHRDDFVNGRSVPLWAIPAGTPISLYRDSSTNVPDLNGHVLGHFLRTPQGLSKQIPYVRFRDSEGKIYEYPALLGGGAKSPHVRHPSFPAIDPIQRGLNYIPSVGFSYPNFATGDNVGPGGGPQGVDTFVRNLQRAVSYAEAMAQRHGTTADSIIAKKLSEN